MSFNDPDTLRQVIEDPDFTVPVVHLPGETGGDDGTASLTLGDPRRIRVMIRRPEAVEYGVTETARVDGVEYLLCAMIDAGISVDDRVYYDNGLTRRAYRVLEPEVTEFDGDSFAWYQLAEDERGDPDEGPVEPDDPDSPNVDDGVQDPGEGSDYIRR